MPLIKESTKYSKSNDTVFFPTVAIEGTLGVRGASIFTGNLTVNGNFTPALFTYNGPLSGTTLSLSGGINSTSTTITGRNIHTFQNFPGSVFSIRSHGSSYVETLLGNNVSGHTALLSSTGDLLVGTFTANNLILGTNNSERLRIDSSGNVGIGLISPTNRLHVQGPAAGISGYFTDGVNSSLVIANLSGGVTLGTDGGGGIHLATGGAASGNRRLSIDANGIISASGNFISNINLTAKTGAYPLVLADANTLVQMNGAFAFTVPLNSTQAYPVGTNINLLALTTGVSVVFTGGITSYATPGLKLRQAGSMATLIKLNTDTWVLTGDLIA